MTSLAKAQSLVDLGRHTEARAEVAGYLAGMPDSVSGLCLLAVCELELENYWEARRATEQGLRLAPESDVVLRLHAMALSNMEQHAGAREAAAAAVRIDANDWINHHTLALVLLNTGDDIATELLRLQAYEAAVRAVELAPHEAEAHVMKGLAAARLERKDEARAANEEALRLDPESALALNNLAALDINSARLGRAARNVTAGLRLSPNERILQQNLDIVVLRLMGRLLNVMLLTGVLPIILVTAPANHAWWARAAVGVFQVCAYTLVVWLTLRHLPRGAFRHLRGLPGRMTVAQRLYGLILVVFAAALLFAAFTPGELWFAGAGVLGVIVRICQILLFVAVMRAVAGWVRRRTAGHGSSSSKGQVR